MQYSQI